MSIAEESAIRKIRRNGDILLFLCAKNHLILYIYIETRASPRNARAGGRAQSSLDFILMEENMNAINSIIVEGNVVRTPDLRETPKGTLVCSIPIAVNYWYKNTAGEKVDEVSYFDIETWGGLAENCAKYCPKGRGVRVVGRLKQSRWKDSDGKTKSRVSIVAEHVEFKPFFKKINASATQEPRSRSDKQELQDLEEAAFAAQQEQEAVIDCDGIPF